jgi:Beta-propeller repeat
LSRDGTATRVERILAAFVLFLIVTVAAYALRNAPVPAVPSTERTLPELTFVENGGQIDSRIRYYAHTKSFSAYFMQRKVVLRLRKGERVTALDLRFAGANPHPDVGAAHRAPGTLDYLIGSRRYTGLRSYTEVRYRELWPGIDLAFRSEAGMLKYEFLVKPGANPADIRLAYAGARSLELDGGALVVSTSAGALRDAAPSSRQGQRRVASRFVVGGKSVGFAVGGYDRRRPLIIDPGLAWSTYFGGAAPEDEPQDVAIDASGNAYVTGVTTSSDFPTSVGALQGALDGPFDAFVTKLDPNGSLLWSTYLGGNDGDSGTAIALDSSGNAYVSGVTFSTDFPTTAGTDRSLGGPGDAFVTKLTSAGGLSYSTYLGGNDDQESANGIAVDAAGAAYVSGTTLSGDFPVTAGAPDAVQSSDEGFVTKLAATGRSIVYSTFLGGSDYEGHDGDFPGGITVDSSGNAYVTGTTASSDFPTTFGVPDATLGGVQDAFLTKINATGTAFAYSMLLGGGSLESGSDLAVDGSGSAVVTGRTSSADYPTTSGAWDRTFNHPAGNEEASFVTKVNAAGTAFDYSTYLDYGAAFGMALDGSGRAYVTGVAHPGFPTTATAVDPVHYEQSDLGNDAFVARLSATGSQLEYGTFLGGGAADYGLAIDRTGSSDVVVVGSTGSTDFPTTPGALEPTPHNGFITKLSTDPIPGYPRPKGATPISVSLVPAYAACSSPNGTHGAPLSYPSCAPPAQTSGLLTMGTPDANGLAADFIGRVVLRVMAGNPSTIDNEANVGINVDLDGIHRRDTLALYSGKLALEVAVRVTDITRGRVTVEDRELPFATITCTNGSCHDFATLNGALPDAIREGRRAIWQLDQIKVYDPGPDGDPATPGDNVLFATQGVFVP